VRGFPAKILAPVEVERLPLVPFRALNAVASKISISSFDRCRRELRHVKVGLDQKVGRHVKSQDFQMLPVWISYQPTWTSRGSPCCISLPNVDPSFVQLLLPVNIVIHLF
jgi:hypothetical protein